MNIYDKLNDGGHDLTMIAPLLAGVSRYYCENCAAIVFLRGGEIDLFHPARLSTSRVDWCPHRVHHEKLRDKLEELHQRLAEERRQADED